MTWDGRITLRLAEMSDADDLFAWRNDPLTCAMFRSTAAVTREQHDQWMKFHVALGWPDHIVIVAETNEHGKLGVVRFDAKRDDPLHCEASITIDAHYRGVGLGKSVLAGACACMPNFTIDAEIRDENAASRKTFAACGFETVSKHDGFTLYRKFAS